MAKTSWYAAFSCLAEPQPLPATGREIGLDVGVRWLLTTSDGASIENPGWYRVEQRRLRVCQRRVARRQKGGSNRRKAVLQLQRQHERIANRRRDFLYQLVHDLISQYDRIALEDLRITNMVRNRPTRFASPQGLLLPPTAQEFAVVYRPTSPRRRVSHPDLAQQLGLFEGMHTG